MSGGTLSSHIREYIGKSGEGLFTQTGGRNTVKYGLYLGYESTGVGAYELSGTGSLLAKYLAIGYWGTGTFRQNAGALETVGLSLGVRSSSSSDPDGYGTYELSGGTAAVNNVYIGNEGCGVLRQTGGTFTVAEKVSLTSRYYNDDELRGTYELGGSGNLLAREEYVGAGSRGNFTQTGGVNQVDYLLVRAKGRYAFTGGTFQINAGMRLEGDLDFLGAGPTMTVNHAIVDFSKGNVLNASQASVTADSNSLFIFRPGFDPHTVFKNFSTEPLIHTAGNTLNVPTGRDIVGWGDLDDHVECAGTLTASQDAWIKINDGLSMSAGSHVNLRAGTLTVENEISGMSGGQLTTEDTYIANNGTGRFVHSDGTHNVNDYLILGYERNAVGTYELGGGTLSADREIIGYMGTGHVKQSGGNNIVKGGVYFGWTESTGTYELSGNGKLVANELRLGYQGDAIGHFTQTGGTNLVTDQLVLGSNHYTTEGIYVLIAGEVSAQTEYVGKSGTGNFTQTGGTNTIRGDLVIALHANFDWAHSDGTYSISGGVLRVGGDLCLSKDYYATATLKVTGADADISVGGYYQRGDGTLVSEVDCDGISTIEVTGTANLAGTWIILDDGAPFARFDILTADGGISGSFASVILPGMDWTWDIDNGDTLWVDHVPEPATLSLLALGGLALIRRRRR